MKTLRALVHRKQEQAIHATLYALIESGCARLEHSTGHIVFNGGPRISKDVLVRQLLDRLGRTGMDSFGAAGLISHPDPLPHSRACGITPHEHGTACASDCPVCGTHAVKAVGFPSPLEQRVRGE